MWKRKTTSILTYIDSVIIIQDQDTYIYIKIFVSYFKKIRYENSRHSPDRRKKDNVTMLQQREAHRESVVPSRVSLFPLDVVISIQSGSIGSKIHDHGQAVHASRVASRRVVRSGELALI